eukprot:CAMPEP_0197464508 /NCGR_PEP_ID=MMETSP1175-20131217/64059_1 /TAXON_ID=1003142 /ORGANISM="Triceratium dubium, Strain CCMP147" /LENGTH=43 /DNA_ID= /DNA_START= /DNA_END= /DNA_ORIENTATION=
MTATCSQFLNDGNNCNQRKEQIVERLPNINGKKNDSDNNGKGN